MNVKEKLIVFTETAMNEAIQLKNDAALENSEKKNASLLESTEKAKKSSSDAIKKEVFKVQQFKNKEMLETSSALKKELFGLRNELISEFTRNVVKKLENHARTEEYYIDMLASIKEICDKYGEIDVHLMQKNASIKDRLAPIIGGEVVLKEDDFLGGFIAIIKSRNGLIDMTYKTKLEQHMKDFSELRI